MVINIVNILLVVFVICYLLIIITLIRSNIYVVAHTNISDETGQLTFYLEHVS